MTVLKWKERAMKGNMEPKDDGNLSLLTWTAVPVTKQSGKSES